MAMAASLAPIFFASLYCTGTGPHVARLHRFYSSTAVNRPRRSCATLSSRLDSFTPDDGDLQDELQHGFLPQRRDGLPVFVTLPADAVSPAGKLRRRKAMAQSFRALVAAGVEGVVMEVWWGMVEKDAPRVYDWRPYQEIVALASMLGLKVRAVMAFHQGGSGPEDPHWIPLPCWVREEMDKDPDLAHSDRFGRRNFEYISIGCDLLPVLRGRSPLLAYADFMRSFRDTFKPSLGVVITGIQVGMGPAGELRYPSHPFQKLAWAWHPHELGEFQCYDKYMLASLNACSSEIERCEWGNGGTVGAGNLMHNPKETEFSRSDSYWSTPYSKFFLEWYSRMLILHGERLCKEADTIFWGTEVNLSAKVARVHWHYGKKSHPSELTAGYYNTSTRDGYLPIARMFGRYGFTLCCTGFDKQDAEDKQTNPLGSPEGFLKQLLLAARICEIPLEGENSPGYLDDESFHRVLKVSKFYSNGLERPSFSFNFVRMDKNLFQYNHWIRFTRFVRQMSDASFVRATVAFGGDSCMSYASGASKIGIAFACH
ncbi:beta-amylase 1, chloroplastic-like [Malania oleifera]|uniref:beta-amylase 1, chloroplastic-like n=1 Tax=Malania oleifera TaxID=397392 RepID=UPI0025AE83B0|nr:beta-amylase 1, chloroplastic-like [Malania oleifera]